MSRIFFCFEIIGQKILHRRHVPSSAPIILVHGHDPTSSRMMQIDERDCINCTCDFCTSAAEGSIDPHTNDVVICLPARILDITSHQWGELRRVDPMHIVWNGREFDSFKRLVDAQHRVGAKPKFGIKVSYNQRIFFLVDATTTSHRFTNSQTNDSVSEVVFQEFPKYKLLTKLSARQINMMRRGERVADSSIISLIPEEERCPDTTITSGWNWTHEASSWTVASVCDAILDASMGDSLPQLTIAGSDNDGGFWCNFDHPTTQDQIKLLMPVIVLARWPNYARQVECFMTRTISDSGTMAVFRDGTRAHVQLST